LEIPSEGFLNFPDIHATISCQTAAAPPPKTSNPRQRALPKPYPTAGDV
jgi:hypothetical protein